MLADSASGLDELPWVDTHVGPVVVEVCMSFVGVGERVRVVGVDGDFE